MSLSAPQQKKKKSNDIHIGYTRKEGGVNCHPLATIFSPLLPGPSSPHGASSHIIVPPRPPMIYASGRVLCISVQRGSIFFLPSHPSCR